MSDALYEAIVSYGSLLLRVWGGGLLLILVVWVALCLVTPKGDKQ